MTPYERYQQVRRRYEMVEAGLEEARDALEPRIRACCNAMGTRPDGRHIPWVSLAPDYRYPRQGFVYARCNDGRDEWDTVAFPEAWLALSDAEFPAAVEAYHEADKAKAAAREANAARAQEDRERDMARVLLAKYPDLAKGP